ncbi:MAG: ABC transporter [Methylococcaceae bacterium]|nr:ABC transporter [Methylococcaceae bacterium]
MKITRHLHQQIRLKNLAVTVILIYLIGVTGWLSTRYVWQVDITGNAANTLSSASQQLLKSLPDKIEITAYIKNGQPIRSQISQLVARYRQHKANIVINFIDPESEPAKTRELNISTSGIILVNYQGREEKISYLDESSLTNALMQLANAKERWITFLSGHGERSPEGEANFDLKEFGKELARRKINTQTLNLATLPAIPDNSALLVITASAAPMLPGEVAMIQQYLQNGGNLLFLSDPENQHASLLKLIGLRQLAGTIVGSNSKLYGIDEAGFEVVSDYPQHPIVQGFQAITLYPVAAAFAIDEDSEYQVEVLLNSSSQSWTETGILKDKIRFDADSNEKEGPLVIAYALIRDLGNHNQQRIVAIGDGDFLSNAYIGNVGNREMGLRIVNWLIHDDRFINIPAKSAVDTRLQLTKSSVAVMGFGFLIVLPCFLLATGLYIWRKRKQS